MAFLSQFVILWAFLPLCTSLLCLHCDNVYRTADCQKVSKCQTGEACFVEQDSSGHGYNLGCRAEQTCSNTTSPVCTQCCKTDTCNSGNMCGISGLSKTAGPLCYSCNSLLDFEDCTKVAQCQKGELCYTEITKNSVLGVDIHSHSCKASQDCPGTGVFSSTGCNSCCAGPMCNTNCTHAVPVSPVSSVRECADITATNATSGVYTIHPFGDTGRAYEVYCYFPTGGEIWTVFQRRHNGSVDFYRNWEDYKQGFGSAHGEYWLGNEVLHALTQASRHTLKVGLVNYHGRNTFSEYRHTTVAGESDGYRLTVGQMKAGNAEDRLTHHCNHMMFSTYDRDNDASPDTDCAQKHHGAWWYADCLCASLNGLYHNQRKTEQADGMIWDDRLHPYKESVMMLRRL